MSELLSKEQAAIYCGLPAKFLSLRCKHGTGPTFIRPSPKTMFFMRDDLDRWIKTWKQCSRTDK
jgi:hypothetical protein